MKTVKGVCLEYQLDRSTVLKAAQQGRIPAHQDGATWLINEEDPNFHAWLHSRRRKTRNHE